MSISTAPDGTKILEQQQTEVRQLVIEGLKQAKKGIREISVLSVTDWRKNIQMHHYNIEITYLAEQDLEDAGDYIAFQLKSPSAALNTVKGIRQQINAIYIIRILHMLVDSRSWLYHTLGISDNFR